MAKHKYSKNKDKPVPASASDNVAEAEAARAGGADKIVPEGRNGRLSFKQKGEIVLYSGGRIPIIDNVRGLICIAVLIVGFGFLHSYSSDFFLHHSYYPGIKIRDWVTPIFLLTAALTMELSFRKRREQEGTKAAVQHVLKRGLAYIVFGLIFDEILLIFATKGRIEYGLDMYTVAWDIFQSIGAGMITAALCMRLKPKHRIVALIALLAVPYIIMLIYPPIVDYLYIYSSPANDSRGWGRLISFFSFGALLVFYNILVRLAFSNFKKYLILYAVLIALTAACLIFTPSEQSIANMLTERQAMYGGEYMYISLIKELIFNPLIINLPTLSFGYLVIGAALGATVLLIAVILNYFYDKEIPLLGAFGKNLLLLFLFWSIAHRNLTGIIHVGGMDGNGNYVLPAYIPILYTTIMMLICAGIAYILDKKKWYFKL